ncbi:MAG: aminotransferase class IV [Clostridia bacterium]|nr:aminotransferase class IV [Clostridia bacterium]
MERVGYFNGQIGCVDEMMIPLCDRSVFFGDAVYEAVLVLNKKAYTLEAHLDRLYSSCALTEISFDMTRDELKSEIAKVIDASEGDTTMLYIQVSRGKAPRKHEYPKDARPNLIMSVTPVKLPPADKRASLFSTEDLRFQYCNIKTVNLLPNVFAAQRATAAGATEALLHRGERVTEAAHSSILMLKDGALVMPPLDNLILPSITRAVVKRLCEENGIPTESRIITVDELMAADEILLCSTTKNVICVFEIDGNAVGGKDRALATRIQALFHEDIYRETGVRL